MHHIHKHQKETAPQCAGPVDRDVAVAVIPAELRLERTVHRRCGRWQADPVPVSASKRGRRRAGMRQRRCRAAEATVCAERVRPPPAGAHRADHSGDERGDDGGSFGRGADDGTAAAGISGRRWWWW
ncbi:uncharacterized protein LOC120906014 [Anopheles arabiensis]|uniref:uncharacterized protein LOC120906014 n=1 Tax=Anopheles arabiensis TaxID=7173 RepID=UPI001AAD1301|nr:uncharacterized protein LOC120906014 [Anopheles arabiensis]